MTGARDEGRRNLPIPDLAQVGFTAQDIRDQRPAFDRPRLCARRGTHQM